MNIDNKFTLIADGASEMGYKLAAVFARDDKI